MFITKMASKQKSQGKQWQCVSMNCFSRDYRIVEGKRVATGIKLFSFPLKDKGRVIQWCNLIKRQNDRDNFKVTKESKVCEKHFPKEFLYRPPGGTRTRLLEGAKPTLHHWNNFGMPVDSSSTMCVQSSKRKSPRKRVRLESPPKYDDDNVDDARNTIQDNLPFSECNTDFEVVEQTDLSETIEVLKLENERLKLQLDETKAALISVKTNSSVLPIITSIKSSDKLCNHYTGFPTLKRLMEVFDFLNPGLQGEKMNLYHNQNVKDRGLGTGRGRKRALPPLEGYILTLIRLRRNFSITHLSFLLNTSEATISTLITTWINFMYVKLGSISIWPSREQLKETIPNSMKEKYPNVRCIIDCVEFKVEVPVSLIIHKMLYSDYKSHTTVKCLVGISPAGGFNFISSIYPGSTSDKEMTIRCGILNPALWEQGDGLMADRGFTIADYTKPMGIDLVIPDFLKGRDQLSPDEVIKSQQIANERIHVERMIQRLKCYHVFDRVIPLTMMGSLNQIVTVCALLSNFQEPIIARQ